jgi:hypothetical protein
MTADDAIQIIAAGKPTFYLGDYKVPLSLPPSLPFSFFPPSLSPSPLLSLLFLSLDFDPPVGLGLECSSPFLSPHLP